MFFCYNKVILWDIPGGPCYEFWWFAVCFMIKFQASEDVLVFKFYTVYTCLKKKQNKIIDSLVRESHLLSMFMEVADRMLETSWANENYSCSGFSYDLRLAEVSESGITKHH